ncbi:MAG: RHS repeat-associated core domain-containing protein, partial [Candidatus Omnitrophica bacterium]|nr:RHS repeat-associated core domain-containing protein [Candidatus Omnitrophota bacterium]
FINSQMSMYYYMQDGLGSVCNLIDQQQTTKNCYIYSAFGELLVDSEMVPQRYKFTGREWDSESSTYNYRPRQMRPSWGRFLRRDPIGYVAGINLYTYVRNNPVNMRDSFGLFPSGEEMVQGISTPLRRIARLEVGSTLGSPRYAALYHTAVALTKEFGDRMFKTLGYEVMFSSLGQGIQGFGGSKLFQTFASSFLSGVKEYAISEDTRSAILAAIQDIAETGQGELTGAPMTFDTPLEEVLEKLQGEGKLTTYACSTREGGHCWGIDLFAVINTDYASMEIINKSKDIRRGKASAFVTGDLPKGGYSTIHDAEAFPLQKSIRFSFVVTWDVDINYNWSPFVTDSLEKTSNVEVKDEDFKYIEYRE